MDAEQYDEDTVLLQQDEVILAKTERQLTATRKQLRAVHAQAQKAAIEAYVTGDGFDSQVGGILDSSVNDAQDRGGLLRHRGAFSESGHEPAARRHEPAGHRAGDPGEDHRGGRRVPTLRGRSRNAAQAATLNVESALSQVKGQLTELVHKARAGDRPPPGPPLPLPPPKPPAARAAAAEGAAAAKATAGGGEGHTRRRPRNRLKTTVRSQQRLATATALKRAASGLSDRGPVLINPVREHARTGRHESSGSRGGHSSRVLPGRAVRVGRGEPPRRRLLGTRHGGLAGGRSRHAPRGDDPRSGVNAGQPARYRAGRSALLPLPRRRASSDHSRRDLHRVRSLRFRHDYPGRRSRYERGLLPDVLGRLRLRRASLSERKNPPRAGGGDCLSPKPPDRLAGVADRRGSVTQKVKCRPG